MHRKLGLEACHSGCARSCGAAVPGSCAPWIGAGATHTSRLMASSHEAQDHHEAAGEPQPTREVFPAIEGLPLSEHIEPEEGRGHHLPHQEQRLHHRLRRQPVRQEGRTDRDEGDETEPPRRTRYPREKAVRAVAAPAEISMSRSAASTTLPYQFTRNVPSSVPWTPR